MNKHPHKWDSKCDFSMALMQRSYKVCICLSLQQRLENSRTTPPMPQLDVQETPPSSDCFYRCHVYVFFFKKMFWSMWQTSQKSKNLPFPQYYFILMNRKPSKSGNLSRFKFQVKLLGLLTRLFGLQQHKRQNQFTSRINGPPRLVFKSSKRFGLFRQGTLPPHAKALNLQQCLLPPLAPKVVHLLDTWPPTNFSPAPHHPPRRRKEVVPWCLIAFSSGNTNTNSSTLKLWWSYCRPSYCKDLRVSLWCFFTQIYCFFRSISFFSPSSPCLGPFSHFLISMIYDCVSDVHIKVEVANHPRFFCCF